MASIETRKSAKGITYRVKIRLEGKPPVTRTFTRLAAAKSFVAETEIGAAQREYAIGSGRTLAAAIDAFLHAELAGKKDQRTLTARVQWWREQLGCLRLRDLTAAHISECLDALAAEPQKPKKPGAVARRRAAATINRYRAAISAVLTWAARSDPTVDQRQPCQEREAPSGGWRANPVSIAGRAGRLAPRGQAKRQRRPLPRRGPQPRDGRPPGRGPRAALA